MYVQCTYTNVLIQKSVCRDRVECMKARSGERAGRLVCSLDGGLSPDHGSVLTYHLDINSGKIGEGRYILGLVCNSRARQIPWWLNIGKSSLHKAPPGQHSLKESC